LGGKPQVIRKREGIQIDEDDLVAALHNLFSADAREQMGPPRIRRRRKPGKKSEPAVVSAEELLARLPEGMEPV